MHPLDSGWEMLGLQKDLLSRAVHFWGLGLLPASEDPVPPGLVFECCCYVHPRVKSCLPPGKVKHYAWKPLQKHEVLFRQTYGPGSPGAD